MEARGQGVRRAATAVFVLGLFVAAAAFVLPRLLSLEPRGSSSTPVPGPSPSAGVDEGAPAVFFPALAQEADGYPEALTSGTLIEEKGCVFLRQGERYLNLVIWPHGWSVERAPDGVLRILDDTGAPVIDVGHYVSLGGGGLGQYPKGPREKVPEDLIGRRIPTRCTANEYWLTSGNLH